MKIKILSKNIIKNFLITDYKNKISFILKEAIENSCDANSSKIIIKINHIKKIIEIIDDGEGIEKNDLKKVTLRYHTSKISKFKDLKNIKYYGYKGESLNLIKTFSSIKIFSKTENDKNGWKITFKKKKNNYKIEENNINLGTRIKFYNIDDFEKNFNIKSLYKIFKNLALSNFKIHFILYKNSKEIFNFPKCNSKKDKIFRIKKIIKNINKKKSIDINYISKKNKINGFLTFSEIKKKFIFKYFFINNRFVENKLLDNILEKLLFKSKKKSLGYCIYLKTKLNIFDIHLYNDKKCIKFNSEKNYKKIFYNMLKNHFDKNKDINYINKENTKENEDSKNYYLLNENEKKLTKFKNKNKFLTLTKDNLIIIEIDKKIYLIKLKDLREKILFNNSIKEFLNFNKLETYQILIPKHYIVNFNILDENKYNSLFNLYGFRIIFIKKNLISLISIPKILINIPIFWERLLNDIIIYFEKSLVIHFSKNRLDTNIIHIIIKNSYLNYPLYVKDINCILKEVLEIKKNDEKWFKKNFFEIC